MIHVFAKLIPPRPDFHLTLSIEEAEIMSQHAIYWKEMQEKGYAPVYGPVMDEKGVYGMGVLEVETMEEAVKLTSDDPVAKCGLMKMELSPMRAFINVV